MSEAKGCAIPVVILIVILTLVVGVGAGAGGIYWFYVANAPANATTTTTTTTTVTPKATAVDDRYAVLYPLEQTLRVQGPLPEKEVKDKVLAKRFDLRKCYQTGLEAKPDLKGEMSLQFTIAGSNGKVTAAVERHTQFPEASVRDCILKEISEWQFSGKRDAKSVVNFDVLMLSMSAAEAAP